MARSGGHFPIVIEFVNLRQDVSFPIAISTAIPISISIARMSHYRAQRHLAIREAMRGKAERDPRRERACARDQADRSDNTASRACRFKVSAEQPPKDGLFLAKLHNPLSYIH